MRAAIRLQLVWNTRRKIWDARLCLASLFRSVSIVASLFRSVSIVAFYGSVLHRQKNILTKGPLLVPCNYKKKKSCNKMEVHYKIIYIFTEQKTRANASLCDVWLVTLRAAFWQPPFRHGAEATENTTTTIGAISSWLNLYHTTMSKTTSVRTCNNRRGMW
jgi:hypothetical protein